MGRSSLLSQGHNSLPVNTEETSGAERKAGAKEDVAAHSNSPTTTTAAGSDFSSKTPAWKHAIARGKQPEGHNRLITHRMRLCCSLISKRRNHTGRKQLNYPGEKQERRQNKPTTCARDALLTFASCCQAGGTGTRLRTENCRCALQLKKALMGTES